MCPCVAPVTGIVLRSVKTDSWIMTHAASVISAMVGGYCQHHQSCSWANICKGDYLCVGGSDKKCSLWTKDGVKLTSVAERDGWMWAVSMACMRVQVVHDPRPFLQVAPRPKQNFVCVGSDDGTLTVFQLVFSTVHGLYQERYAYRDFMTDVIIQHLTVENKRVRVRCRDYVRKIALYKNRLAVQLPDRILVYEQTGDGEADMQYRVPWPFPATQWA